MGLVSGKTASQDSGLTPKYSVLGAGTGYEVRAYEPYVVAEVQGGPEAGPEDDRFRTLAKVSERAYCIASCFLALLGRVLAGACGRDGERGPSDATRASTCICCPCVCLLCAFNISRDASY